MGKGTASFGKRRNKTDTLCLKFSSPEEPLRFLWIPCSSYQKYNWSKKATPRKTTGTGRMRYLKYVTIRLETNFREGTLTAPRKKGATPSS
ncbi:60S ribosomal protein L37, putative [Ricinus communis]|uniref:60S ribosomal protein L37, putative n=1 Tax=Ricinus communis TaxID=3988 RepID=B9RKQ7_RICCO|nr:60S ribosomal protein L37, putative [Ricinus communis]